MLECEAGIKKGGVVDRPAIHNTAFKDSLPLRDVKQRQGAEGFGFSSVEWRKPEKEVFTG